MSFDLGPEVLGAALTAAAHGAALWVLGRIASPRRAAGLEPPLDELKQRWALWTQLEVALTVGSAALLGLGWWWLLHRLSVRPRSPDAVFQATPGWICFSLPALFLALLSATIPVTLVFRALLGPERLREYTRYQERLYQLDGKRALLVIGVPVLLVALGGAVALLDAHAVFEREGLVVRPFGEFETTRRPWSSVTAVKHVRWEWPEGVKKRAPDYIVEFADGFHWTTTDMSRQQSPEEDAAIASFVCARSGRRLEEVTRPGY